MIDTEVELLLWAFVVFAITAAGTLSFNCSPKSEREVLKSGDVGTVANLDWLDEIGEDILISKAVDDCKIDQIYRNSIDWTTEHRTNITKIAQFLS